MLSYAQNREDVLLNRVFPAPVGFYLDVGAADPVELSVTKWFYDQGWSGINVEPQPGYYNALVAARPRDVNLNVALSDAPGEVTFYELPAKPGWSTTDPATADRLREAGEEVVPRSLHALTLAEVCERYARGPIDFLKVDVEEAEAKVLAGADWSRWRPRVLVVEATRINSPALNHEGWEPLVLAAGYLFAFFDGLNRYYVRAEEPGLAERLAVPANVFDDYVPFELTLALDGWNREREALHAELGRVGELCQALHADAEALRARVGRLEAGLRSPGVPARAVAAAVRALRKARRHLGALRGRVFGRAGGDPRRNKPAPAGSELCPISHPRPTP